jgi:SAM-dependent methyltransferase
MTDVSARYLPSFTVDSYLHHVAVAHPRLRSALDFDRPGAVEALDRLTTSSSEFDSDQTGRGDSYRRAQQDSLVRWTGIRELLRWATPTGSAGTPVVLDVLGGDGTLARAASGPTASPRTKLILVTGDQSGPMVDRALAQGLPAVRQAADFLFLADRSMDGVLLAYGTHHIAPAHRPAAVAEAVRVTRPGGRVVLHDFDWDSPMAGFFTDVVHPHAIGGHAYAHFTRPELAALFRGMPTRVVDLYDPLQVRAGTEQTARARMCRYVGDMYGVHEHFAALGSVDAAWHILERHFDHSGYPRMATGAAPRPVVYRVDDQFVAEVPRMAIVAVADKVVRR